MKNIVINFIKMIFGLIVNIFVSIIEKIGNIFSNIGYVITPPIDDSVVKEREPIGVLKGEDFNEYFKKKNK